MPNENGQHAAEEQIVQDQTSASQEAAPPAPADLAEAFAQVRAANVQATQDNLEDTGDSEEPVGKHARQEPKAEQQEPADADQQASVPAAADAAQHANTPATPEPEQPAGNDGVGGDTVSSEPTDYTPAREQIYQGINTQAVQNVVARFKENGIRTWDIADLYDKDEQTGRVTFKNPDDEQRPFQSRKEAQDFVDAMNKQINNKFQSEIRAEQAKLLEEAKPSLSILDFVPVYQSMTEIERQVFDDLIGPYAIRDANNNIQGFNVDLAAAASQAKAIASRFATQQQPQQQAATKEAKKEQATSPATDMATGTGEVGTDEPKDLSEAFALLNKQKKEKNNG